MFKRRLTIVRQISRCRRTRIEKEIKNEIIKTRLMTNQRREIAEKINFVDDSLRRFNYHDVNINIIQLLFILQTKLRIVVSLHIQFSSVRAIFVALSAKISRIVRDETEISRSKIAIFVFISVFSKKRRECDELTQCVSRLIIAILSENEIFDKNNFQFILNFINTLQKKNVFV